jgi:hypothetical protein
MNKTLIILGALVLASMLVIKSKKTQNVIIVGGCVLLGVGLFFSKSAKSKAPEAKVEAPSSGGGGGDLGSKLSENGWLFFGNNGCPWCTKQKEALGDGHKSVFVDVNSEDGANVVKALQVEIEGVPHWFNKNTKKSFSGFRPEEELAKLLQ